MAQTLVLSVLILGSFFVVGFGGEDPFKYQGEKALKFQGGWTMDVRSKAGVVNFLAEKFGLSTYLEISCPTSGHRYSKIRDDLLKKELFLYKIGRPDLDVIGRIDLERTEPVDYDEGMKKLEGRKFDIIFVDPWHTFEVSKRNLVDALRLVKDDGFIVIHDCYPGDERLTGGKYRPGDWTGQTYEACAEFFLENNFNFFTIDSDYGVGVVSLRHKPNKKEWMVDEKPTKNSPWRDYRYMVKMRKSYLNLVTAQEFQSAYEKMIEENALRDDL